LVVIIGGFILIGLGLDSFIQTVLALVVGYYFGRRQDIVEELKE